MATLADRRASRPADRHRERFRHAGHHTRRHPQDRHTHHGRTRGRTEPAPLKTLEHHPRGPSCRPDQQQVHHQASRTHQAQSEEVDGLACQAADPSGGPDQHAHHQQGGRQLDGGPNDADQQRAAQPQQMVVVVRQTREDLVQPARLFADRDELEG
jgi:hypothetical protein